MKNENITKMAYKKLLRIARETIPALEDRVNLEPQWSDDADFIETSVWSLDALLKKAYQLGKADGNKN